MFSARATASTASARDSFSCNAALVTLSKWSSQKLNDPSSSSIGPAAGFSQRFTSHFSVITLPPSRLHMDAVAD
jgi:hypothetical protein